VAADLSLSSSPALFNANDAYDAYDDDYELCVSLVVAM
jgi:hypothetical protein